MFQLTATPASALADEPVHIRVTGLPPFQMVTFKASLKDEKGNLFHSKAFYRANETGKVDLEQDPAFGGDYVGVHPMGLFWSLKPERAFQRLLKQDVMASPFLVTLDLYDSVCFQDLATAQPTASQTLQRWFSGPGMQRMQIREGRVRGALFLPPGEGPFPGVIDLFGGIGGLVEFRASLLSAHGFAVLALAYFAYEDLPKQLQEVELEYFEEAVNLLLAHPKIQKSGIGVISVCKGAEIGLAMACYLKQVVATVCINGFNAIFTVPLRYKDLVVKPIHSFKERIQIHVSGAVRICHCMEDPRDELNRQSVLPVEKAQGRILFIVGENDECLNSRVYAEQAVDQLQSHGKSSGRMLMYPGAGHLIEPPYAPLCYASWSPGFSRPILWGGDPAAHAAAQEHAWEEIQKFFRQYLSPTRSKL
ncbi:acyl-coenzyme A amino acid N-acyltransferase 2-like [Loxodonta africana]|uniref:acyl-coenzyme A amino acid N-acyltransferase 2-like n=1 Tax=Loxodonta africana TaxID=9785 RepID=UPI0030D42DB1